MSNQVVPSVNNSLDAVTGLILNATLVWDSDLLDWVKMTQPGASVAGLTDGELRATPVPVSGTITATGPLTDTQLRLTPVPVSGTITASGPLTDAQLRAADVKVTLDSEVVPVTGTFFRVTQPVSIASMPSTPVTGTFFQATQPVSLATAPTTPVTGTFWQATQPVSGTVTATGPLTDSQLRATPVSTKPGVNVTTWVSVKSAAPTANAVQADTGALVAGDYDFELRLMCSDTVAVGKGLVIEHRNAANNATLFVLGGASPNGGTLAMTLSRYPIATNERLRVIAGTAAGAASSMYVSAIGRRTT